MFQKILTNRSRQLSLALLVADIMVCVAVNPRQASASWLIIGFILLALTIFSITTSVSGLLQTAEDGNGRGHRFSRYAAVVIIAMIGLQSIGQLTAKDTVAMLPLVAVAYLYLGYGRKRQTAPAVN